jgi:hypothetical protein
MTDVVAAIQSAIEIVGKLRALSKTVENADFKMLLADLSGDLADAKLEVANLKISLAQCLDENQSLKNKLTTKSSTKPTPEDGAYSFEDEDGLFCTACFDTKNQKVRVSELSPSFRVFGKWKCPSCGAKFGKGL